MNLVHCMIDLRPGASALGFAGACGAWMDHLAARGVIRSWRLMRRKLGLASSGHPDFLLEIEIEGLGQLDTTFAALAERDDAAEDLYDRMHQMIARGETGLYRPYPDPSQRERVALL